MATVFDSISIGTEIGFSNVSNDPTETLWKLYVRDNNLYFNGLTINSSISGTSGITDDITTDDKSNFLFKKNFNMPNTNNDVRFFQEKYF